MLMFREGPPHGMIQVASCLRKKQQQINSLSQENGFSVKTICFFKSTSSLLL